MKGNEKNNFPDFLLVKVGRLMEDILERSRSLANWRQRDREEKGNSQWESNALMGLRMKYEHIRLYVNGQTEELAEEQRKLEKLSKMFKRPYMHSTEDFPGYSPDKLKARQDRIYDQIREMGIILASVNELKDHQELIEQLKKEGL